MGPFNVPPIMPAPAGCPVELQPLTARSAPAVTGSVVSLGQEDNSTSVDLTGVPLTLNGASGMTPDALTAGARLVVVGSTDGSGTFTPTAAFGFDSADQGPVGHND